MLCPFNALSAHFPCRCTPCYHTYLALATVLAPCPLAVVHAVSVLLTPLFFYLCMDPSMANMGLDGSALAATMTQLTSLIGLLGYIVSRNIKKSGPSTWQGWQLGLAFSNWYACLTLVLHFHLISSSSEA